MHDFDYRHMHVDSRSVTEEIDTFLATLSCSDDDAFLKWEADVTHPSCSLLGSSDRCMRLYVYNKQVFAFHQFDLSH